MIDFTPNTALVVGALIAAPFVGSFLGLLVVRLPAHEPIIWGRSKCRSCDAPLGIRELVPILSYLMMSGRCRHCTAPISILYPLMELGAVLVVIASAFTATGLLFVVSCLLGWALLVLAGTDLTQMVLPNVLTVPLIPAGLAASLLLPDHPLIDHLLGAVAGGLILWLVAHLYQRLRRRAGVGMGDVKLLSAGGAWLGWAALPYVVLLATTTCLLGVGVLRLRGRQFQNTTAVPFGAGLASSIYITWIVTINLVT